MKYNEVLCKSVSVRYDPYGYWSGELSVRKVFFSNKKITIFFILSHLFFFCLFSFSLKHNNDLFVYCCQYCLGLDVSCLDYFYTDPNFQATRRHMHLALLLQENLLSLVLMQLLIYTLIVLPCHH